IPLPIEFGEESIQLAEGTRTVFNRLNPLTAVTKQLVTGFEKCCVPSRILHGCCAVLSCPRKQGSVKAALKCCQGKRCCSCWLHSLVKPAMVAVELLEV